MINVFVGTLESGEAEFEESRISVLNQQDIRINHYVISGLDERSAHQELIKHWLKVRNIYDFFVKVDADTILTSNFAIHDMVQFMISKKASGLQVRLLDYFSNYLISGLNMFSNKVEFKTRPSRLKPDALDYNHTKILKGDEVKELEPIGLHGKYPNPKQSFFYGYHRFLKGQTDTLGRCFQLWEKEKDCSRLWALIGAYSASSRTFGKYLFSSREVDSKLERFKNAPPNEETIYEFAKSRLVLL